MHAHTHKHTPAHSPLISQLWPLPHSLPLPCREPQLLSRLGALAVVPAGKYPATEQPCLWSAPSIWCHAGQSSWWDSATTREGSSAEGGAMALPGRGPMGSSPEEQTGRKFEGGCPLLPGRGKINTPGSELLQDLLEAPRPRVIKNMCQCLRCPNLSQST